MDRETQRRAMCCELVDEVARTSGQVRLKVTGTSMLPAIWPGDLITVQHCNTAELRLGQIVLYRQEGKLTAHRIHGISPSHVITQGDSVPTCDPPVGAHEIVGQVVSIFRGDHWIQPGRSFWHVLVSPILRHLDFCTRITLLLGSRPRRSEET